ncbi:hypothetical protein D1AOALGA4SA_9045 [Olavius algarvensis Delta 1 endosymbiont]|nr:hypothetical protein D1AOALGA4SA_9045 [Olavius algarvensis Delta 1 endosymbiont]
MVNSVKIKVLKPVKTLLGSGMSVKKISLCIALGAVLGIFPVIGSTTLLCTFAALLMRLNLPAIQAINYLVYPLQIVLLAPFYGAGNWLFGDRSSSMIEANILDLLKNDFWGGMAGLWDLTVYAVVVWLMISPLLVLILYCLMKPVIRRIAESDGLPRSLKSIFTS